MHAGGRACLRRSCHVAGRCGWPRRPAVDPEPTRQRPADRVPSHNIVEWNTLNFDAVVTDGMTRTTAAQETLVWS